MMRSRFRLRAMGLCLALAGLMAFVASSAQAEVGAKWLIAGTAVTNALKAELQSSLEGNHGTLLGTIAGMGIHILCTGMSLVAGNQLLVEGGWLGKALFSGCKFLRLKEGKAETLGACTPAGGHITTELLYGLLSLHKLASDGKVDTVVVIERDLKESTLLAKIVTGEECAFGEIITVSGKLAVIDTTISTNKVTHLITEFAPLTHLYLNGNLANRATLDGSAEISLAGKHAGMNWAGDPA